MTKSMQTIIMALGAGGITVAALVLVVVDELQGKPLDSTTLTLLSFVLGMSSAFLGTHVGSTITTTSTAQVEQAITGALANGGGTAIAQAVHAAQSAPVTHGATNDGASA